VIDITGMPTPANGRLAFRYFVESGGPTGANSNYIGIDTFTFTDGVPAQPGITIVKEAIPADGTNFGFTTNALPSTPTFALTWGNNGSGNSQFDFPDGVAVDTDGNVYETDTANHRIQKFDGSGNILLAGGSQGSGNGQFASPVAMAVDAAGNLYVADAGNDRIQKFDGSGNFLLAWGSEGSGNGQFNLPHGVAVDAAGNLYVADNFNHRIQKFTTNTFALDDAVPDDGDMVTDAINFTSLSPGSYTFTEAVTAGWSLTNLSCDGGNWTTSGNSVTINLAAGEHITCTFRNFNGSYLFMPVVIR
jgi:DNA-binding beta-propeller fold protein YncE